MCGIAGILHFESSGPVDPAVLERMRDRMAHRGPDGAGLWLSPDHHVGLGHRRLSIVDLADTANQPMTNEDRSVWLIFNGEIYNHLVLRTELARKGHRFATDHSDTEVLVHGYEEWGVEGLLERLEGMFTVAIWDERRRHLFLIRDRVGIKPLYFAFTNQGLIFASEIKGLVAHPSVEADVEPIAMYHYLSFLTTPAPLTMFRGIYKVPAGYYLDVGEDSTFRAVRYWDALPGRGIDPAETRGLSATTLEEFYVRGIRERLDAAVQKRLMSDVPFGVFLSGGIDSSVNTALMSKYMDRPVDTFTVGFSDYTHLNELEYASQVAKRFKTNHHTVMIEEGDMRGYLDSLVHSQDEPIADWVCIPLYFVTKLAVGNGCKVIQVGEGSDEQFCGYASYMGYLDLYRKYWQPFRRWVPTPLQQLTAASARALAAWKPGFEPYADIVDRAARNREHFWSGATVFWDIMKRQLVTPGSVRATGMDARLTQSGLLPESYLQPDTFNVIADFQQRIQQAAPQADVLNRMIYNEFKLRLPELLLMRVDKVTMSESLEARVPFLDHKLVEFTMDIPMEWKVRGHNPKYLLKKAVAGLIPDEIIHRKKMGFGAPMSQWLRGNFGRRVESAILGSRLMDRGMVNREYVRTLCRDHQSGRRDNSLYLWTLFNLTAWYDYWVDGLKQAA